MPKSFLATVTRLRQERGRRLMADATVLFRQASDVYESTDPDGSRAANGRRRAAHLLAARAERLAARSYLWSPSD
ncbi:hypothetical protein [Streptomyces sp. STCH 565 A]|uniref:hypothetical protein n=1 Tax=Streptomyces sp. STCH 565 A TaxID=2950532 RepID=UPI002075EAB6|nr:hypothetical protein [Streptomyces sp. STCH 565 A]MCM8548910.1 hypothetical protein [Streptomyces sp. STCH 565 A]